MPEFQLGQSVRVREGGGDPSYPPDKTLLGKEGTIQRGTGEPAGRNRHFLYFVKFDSEEVRAISGDWLEPMSEREGMMRQPNARIFREGQ